MSKKMIICLLLDESGSMSPNKDAALAGINEYIETMKADYEAKPELGDIYFSFITFSSSYGAGADPVRFKYNLRHISEVEKIPSDMYTPNGGTPLLQAMGRTMESLDVVDENNNDGASPLVAFMSKTDLDEAKIVMVVQTDGEETEWNSAYTKDKITKMIKEREDKGNWTFVFLGAGIDAISEGMKMGISAGSSYSMNKNVSAAVAYSSTYTGAAVATSNLRSSSVMNSVNYVAEMDEVVKNLESKLATPEQPKVSKSKSKKKETI